MLCELYYSSLLIKSSQAWQPRFQGEGQVGQPRPVQVFSRTLLCARRPLMEEPHLQSTGFPSPTSFASKLLTVLLSKDQALSPRSKIYQFPTYEVGKKVKNL